MQAILERNSALTADAIARAFDSLTAPPLAPDVDLRTEAELHAIAKRDRKARRRHMEALSQYWGTLQAQGTPRFLDLHVFAINHLIPPDTVVEWTEKHAPDEIVF